MPPRVRLLRTLDIYHTNLSRLRTLASRPPAAFSQRTYARYSRFEDYERGNKGEDPDDPDDREFKRKFELFKTYGTAAVAVGAGTVWYISQYVLTSILMVKP